MSDIVKDLYHHAEITEYTIFEAAADEIESLRQALADSDKLVEELMFRIQDQKEELAALKQGQGEPVAWTSGKKFDGELETDDEPHEGWFALYTAPTIPEGWQLVPVEPTPEMMGAACKSIRWYEQEVTARAVYQAMLAAAPKPSQQAAHMPVKTYCGGKPNYCKESDEVK